MSVSPFTAAEPTVDFVAMFRSAASRSPDAVAVVDGDEEVSFAELARRARSLGSRLQKLGVGPDVLVAIHLERSLDALVAVLGTLLAGGGYLPIDPSYPRQRRAFMIADASPRVVITRRRFRAALPTIDAAALYIDATHEEGALEAREAGPEHLGYVIYTSGSTGRPKGVVMPRGPLSNLVRWQLEQSEVTRTLQYAPLSFDVHFQELFATWCAGGTLVMVADQLRMDAPALIQHIEHHRVERLFLPFVALQELARSAVATGRFPRSLREVITAGEQLQCTEAIRAFFAELDGATLTNQYGPSETHVVTAHRLEGAPGTWQKLPPIGKPIDGARIAIADADEEGVGEILIGGDVLARGYLDRPDLTAERFVEVDGARMYRTGDLGGRRDDGDIVFFGRADDQVKVRGYRVELGEVELALTAHPAVAQAAVSVHTDASETARLLAHVVYGESATPPSATELRRFVSERLPDYMVPSLFVALDALPRTPSGKVDRRALPEPSHERPELDQVYVAPQGERDAQVAEVWREVLGVDRVGIDDHFFELGGTSLLALRAVAELRERLGVKLPITALFEAPTVRALTDKLTGEVATSFAAEARRRVRGRGEAGTAAIAIVGMAGRFPGAASIDELWQNLEAGVESVTFFDEGELDPRVDASVPGYVAARGIIEEADRYDPAFFGDNPRAAELVDPQQRVLLEVAWHALEDAGVPPDRFAGRVGVYAGVGNNTYWSANVVTRPERIEAVGDFVAMVSNEKDYVATRIAHKLDLTGPALSIHTACSTSLVAVAAAVEALRRHECDAALAGGAAITVPLKSGHVYTEGAMLSPDGHCRPFDAKAQGTLFSDGAAMVVLERLDDAIARGRRIYAVIRGVATNNDGAKKASFTAPSIEGQASVIAMAQADAGVSPDTIGYVEAHGTATPLGDPIEIEALRRAFREGTDACGFCGVGSIKSNIGHLTAAAGVAGLIKAALSLHHDKRVPSLHFETPNPSIDFDGSPFFVQREVSPWPRGSSPRRAAVSSFGVGGTNAHVVLEEAPEAEPTTPTTRPALLLASGRTEAAADRMREQLVAAIESGADAADVAFTSQVGRAHMPHRRFRVGGVSGGALFDGQTREVVFMFPGQGAQYLGMGSQLAEREPAFRDALERVMGALEPDLRAELEAVPDEATLQQTRLTQPALFAMEYALAAQWQSWGLSPAAMVGHSVGEFVAAAIAGVMAPEEAARLVAARGALIQELPPGIMLSVRAGAETVAPRLSGTLALAASNGPALSVVSGPAEEIHSFAEQLDGEGVACRVLHTSHAFHSPMMDPAVVPFEQLVADIELAPPRIPFVSTVTGTWIRDDEATDPAYWARHLRAPVRFTEAVSTLWEDERRILLDVGPRAVTSTLARQAMRDRKLQVAIASLTDNPDGEHEALFAALGRLWLHGVSPDWNAVHVGERRRVVSLPGYPFARDRVWLEPADAPVIASTPPASAVPSTVEPPETVSAEPPVGRRERLQRELGELIEDASGISVDAMDVSLMELGLDSLILTQLALALGKRYGIAFSFRELMQPDAMVAALAERIDAELPDEPEPVATPPAAAPQAVAPAAEAPTLERIAAQLAHMQAQIDRLSGGAAPRPAPDVKKRPAKTPPANRRGKTHGPQTKIDTSGGGALLPSQQRALDAFIASYVERTKASKAHTAENRRHFADPRVVSGFRPLIKEMVYPIVVDRSEGSKVWDIDGNEYVDITCGFGADYFGHRPKEVIEAVKEQLDRGIEIGPQHPLAAEVTAQICRFTGAERAALCNTGSEAVLGALRTARTVTGRDLVVAFEGAYHGITDQVIVRGVGSGARRRTLPAAAGIPKSHVENMLIVGYDDPESLRIIEERASEIAAVLVEPVQSRRPALQPRQFLRDLRALTERLDIPLIFDEVITGFRIRPGGAQEYFGVRADLGTYGKILGGGMPIAAIAGKRRYMDALDGGHWQFGDASVPEVGVTYFAGTFVRHPPALAAAHAALSLLEREPDTQARVNALTEDMVARLNAALEAASAPMHVDSCGSLFKLKVDEDVPLGYLVYWYLRHAGIHIWEDRPLFLTTAHTPEDVDRIVKAFADTVDAMQRAQLLPGGSTPSEVPATEAQREIWAAARMSTGASLAYNEAVGLRMRGPLDVDALAAAFPRVIARHDALRARFSSDGTCMIVDPQTEVSLRIEDLRDAGDDERERRVAEVAREEVNEPFDLERGPLVRARLLRLADDDNYLAFTAHHIVCDGWSTAVVLNDLGRLYGEQTPGRTFQFSEYALGQTLDRHRAAAREAEDYWREVFRDGVPVLDLPADHRRPPVRTFNASRVDHALDEQLIEALKALAKKLSVSYFSLLMGAFAALLHRLTTEPDLVIGVPSAGQATVGEDFLVGHCVNLLPIRTRVERERPFADYVSELRGDVVEAYGHHQVSFGELVRKLDVPRDPSRVPLVSVMFNYDKGLDDFAFEGIEAELISHPRAFEAFEMFVNVSETNGRTVVECQFNTDLFDETSIARHMEAYATLLGSAVADPQTPMGRLDVLGPEERRRLVDELNPSPSAYPDGTAVELFHRAVDRAPEAVAVVGPASVTYAELERRANRLAHHLRALGVGSGACVAIATQRGVDVTVAILGTLAAGAAYVPISASHPAERTGHVLADSGASVLITDAASRSAFAGFAGTMVSIDGDAAAIANASDERIAEATVDDLAYVIYTSGTTGRPKGVEVPHRALTNFLVSMARTPGVSAKDTLFAVTTITFDISVLELLLPLTVGGRCVIADDATVGSGAALVRELARSGATLMQGTPSTFRLLLAGGWDGDRSIRLLCGGEPMPRDLIAPLLERSAELWNMYGPTETTIWSTCARITDPEAPISIGRPIANTRVYLLDEAMQLVPRGVLGHLHIGGDGLARGYRNLPDLTRARFVEDPFAQGARIYETGDYARHLADGSLLFERRMDTQVKVRGFRVELGEIEVELARHPAVKTAAAAVHELRPGDVRLAAHVVAEPGGHVDASELRAHLEERLPEYMVPQHIVEIGQLPLNPSGKVDRKALQLPREVQSVERSAGAAPRTAEERYLASLWERILGVEGVRPSDNFFDLGGHSLLAMEVIAAVKADTGTELAPRVLMVGALAQVAAQLSVPEASAPPASMAEPPTTVGIVGDPLEMAPQPLPGLRPMFFGPDESLFGIHHPPVGGRSVPTGVVICPPVGHEYVRAHRACHGIAQRLAQDGFHVLRFDPFGVGDSAGDFGDVARWCDDVRAAAVLLRRLSRAARIVLVGARFGAAMAILTAAGHGDADALAAERLVLWDPVVRGESYLSTLDGLHERLVGSPVRFRESRSSRPDELLGGPFPSSLRSSIRDVDLLRSVGAIACPVTVIATSRRADDARLVRELEKARHVVVDGVDDWSDPTQIEQTVQAGRVIAAIAEELSDA